MEMNIRLARAAVMKGAGNIEIQEFPSPEIKENEALLKVELSGICGTDKNMYKGFITHPGGKITPFPIIPGHEIVGIIHDIGEEAKATLEGTGEELKRGDRVVPVCDVGCGTCFNCRFTYGYVAWCERSFGYGTLISCKDPPHLFGGWSQYTYIHPNTLLFKAEKIPPEVAVLTEPFAVAYGTLMKAMHPCSPTLDLHGFNPGDTIVIQGPGPIGLIHAIMARIVGAGDIIIVGAGTEADSWRVNYISKEFANVVDYTVNERDSESRVREVLSLTGGKGADLVIECTGVPDALVEGLEMLRGKGGMLLIVGIFIDVGRSVEINPARLISHKGALIMGVPNHPLQGYRVALKLMRKFMGRIPFHKIVTHIYPLDKAKKAVEKAVEGKVIKVAIAPNKHIEACSTH